MALTTLVKDELANYEATKVSARKAEISTILRFTGGLHIVSGRIVVESEVDHEATAHRMRRPICMSGELQSASHPQEFSNAQQRWNAKDVPSCGFPNEVCAPLP